MEKRIQPVRHEPGGVTSFNLIAKCYQLFGLIFPTGDATVEIEGVNGSVNEAIEAVEPIVNGLREAHQAVHKVKHKQNPTTEIRFRDKK